MSRLVQKMDLLCSGRTAVIRWPSWSCDPLGLSEGPEPHSLSLRLTKGAIRRQRHPLRFRRCPTHPSQHFAFQDYHHLQIVIGKLPQGETLDLFERTRRGWN